MRTFATLAILLALGALLSAQSAITLQPSTRVSLTDCPAGGGDGGVLHSARLAEGRYLFRVLDEPTRVCVFPTNPDGGKADGCPYTLSDGGTTNDGGVCPICSADGGVNDGDRFPAGTIFLWSSPRAGQTVACRSGADGGGGDVIWTRVQ